MATEPCPDCGEQSYRTRDAAKAAFWATDPAADLTPETWRCPSGRAHYRPLTREAVAAQLAAKGIDLAEPDLTPHPPSPDRLPRRRKSRPKPAAEYAACPRCGSGWGRPHYERCNVDVPDYDDQWMPSGVLTGLTAYALAVFPLDVVRRSTVRAMLPRGVRAVRPAALARREAGESRVSLSNAKRNRVSDAFTASLAAFRREEWIRTTETAVLIVARHPLNSTAGRRLRERPDLIVSLRQAIAVLAESLGPATTVEGQAQRERELAALRRLMQEAPAQGPHGGRGYVKLTHGTGRL